MSTNLQGFHKPKCLSTTLLGVCCALALQSHAYAGGSNKFYVDKAGNAVINVTDTSGVSLSISSGDVADDVVYTLESSTGTINDTLSGVTGNLTVRTGGGMDSLDISSLEVGKSLNIHTGSGADSVDFFGLTVGRNLTIRTAGGDDVIEGGMAFVGGRTLINTGANNDSVEIGGITTMKNLLVFSGAGSDFVDLQEMTTHGITTVRTGAGADEIALTDIENSNVFRVFTGRGDDNIEIAGMTFSAPSRILLGNGDDTLEVTESVFNNAPLLNGGAGHDTYETEDNNAENVKPKIVHFEEIIDVTEPEEPVTYAIGDTGPGGGIVFEINDAGTSGLEIMSIDLAMGAGVAYGCSGINVEGVNDTANGINDPQSGADKTSALITANCGADAAILASDYVSTNGSTGWFLPSAPELRSAIDQGIGLPGLYVWSSSEQTQGSAFLVLISTGAPSPASKTLTAGSQFQVGVAPVRAF